MKKMVYDVFIDDYIDIEKMDPCAPPERYKEITEELLISNAARWFSEALRDKEEKAKREKELAARWYTCKKCNLEFLPALFNANRCPRCGEEAKR